MSTVKLYKGEKTDSSSSSYQCASYDFENATVDLDYTIVNQATGTFPTTGEALKQIRINISLAGINFLTGYDEVPTSRQNLVPPPVYSGEGTQDNPYDISSSTEVPIGQKPADWDLHYMTKYFTRGALPVVGTSNYFYNYSSAGVAQSGSIVPTWNEETQYYEVSDLAQIFYTDATGFFGVSRLLSPTSSGIEETVRVLYNRRAYGGGNFYSNEFWWKANGAFGTQLFTQSLATSQKVMIAMSSSQNNPINSYQSRLLVQMIRFDYDEETYTGVVVISLSADGLPQQAQITALSAPFWKEETTPASGGDYSTSQGGHGAFSGPSDNRGNRSGGGIATRTRDWNAISALYNANQNRYWIETATPPEAFFQAINALWSPSLWESFANNFFNPRDAIVACHLMPEKLGPPPLTGHPSRIHAAERTLSTAVVPTFGANYTHLHVGDLDITEPRWYEGFPDFDNTAIYIHLPYIGVKQLDIEAVMEGVLSVDYVSDVLSGDVIATVWTQDRFGNCNYRYEFKGNCAQVFPLSARDATMGTNIGAAVASTVGRVAIAAATGGISELVGGLSGLAGAQGGSLAGAGELFKNGIQNDMVGGALKGVGAGVNSLANSVSAANSGTATLGSNGQTGPVTAPVDTQCYLIISRPKWSNPEHYAAQFGYPSDIGGTINSKPFEGFLSCRTIVLNGLTATDAERAEIATLMASGVYV